MTSHLIEYHPASPQTSQYPAEKDADSMTDAVEALLLEIGEDPDRDGLRKTPQRVADAMRFLTSGYNQSLDQLLNGAIFDEDHHEMVLVVRQRKFA